mmetsp:Transcript_3213/g.6137  ORF Transcript_3213/g.6137 Transcript_3213/m.6137 type:complete len:239 (+) Transcript_3213:100-816(+)
MKERCCNLCSRRRQWLCVILLLLSAVSRTHAMVQLDLDLLLENDNTTTTAPTASNMTTAAPTAMNSSNTTFAPTMAPTNATDNVTTVAPTTVAPTVANTSAPTMAPVTQAPTTAAPTVPGTTPAPTVVPTSQPSGGDKPAPPHHGISFFRFVEKTIAYLILLVLALLGFGAFMANRYRIYFFLRGVWYTILQMECTLWLIRQLRLSDYFGYQPVDPSLNPSIFENELNEGLLMRETDT